jgi:hypothetical protein
MNRLPPLATSIVAPRRRIRAPQRAGLLLIAATGIGVAAGHRISPAVTRIRLILSTTAATECHG